MRVPGFLPSAGLPATPRAVPLFAPDAAAAAVRMWRPGQVLTVTVASAAADGSARVRIHGVLLTARGGVPLEAGMTFQARVERLGEPMVLRILPEGNDTLSRAWRAVLPRQHPLALLTAVMAAARQHAAANDPLATATGRLLEAIPALPALAARPEALRQAVRNTGLFYEARLAAGEQGLDADLKAQWLRLAQWVRTRLSSSPPPVAPGAGEAQGNEGIVKILQHAEAAWARIQHNQLATLASAGAQGVPAAWLIELPVRDRDGHGLLRLRIVADERYRAKAATAAPVWSVSLDFELPSLGPIHARIRWHEEGQVGVAFWAERPTTRERLRANLDDLRAGLREAGLEAGRLDCLDGPLPSPPDPGPPADGLLDERA